MQTQPWQNRVYDRLAQNVQRGGLHKHCAYLEAGWLSLFWIRPRLGKTKQGTLTSVAAGGVLLLMGLLLSGKILGALQPILIAAGTLSGATWLVLLVLGLFGWRYFVGRALLRRYLSAMYA
ncbi:hypothetical protein P5X00_34225 [Paraburkholderia sp. A2RO-4L]